MAIHALESKTKSKSTEACTIKLPPILSSEVIIVNKCLPSPQKSCAYTSIYTHILRKQTRSEIRYYCLSLAFSLNGIYWRVFQEQPILFLLRMSIS